MTEKVSIRFFDDSLVRAVWDEENAKATRFVEWFSYSDETIDGKSKQKAYALFESSFIDSIEVGTINALMKIHLTK